MAEAPDETLFFDEWIDSRRGVCLIKAGDYRGTGFHFGSGWIMSVAHNFRGNHDDPPNIHSLLSGAQFIFERSGEEKKRRQREQWAGESEERCFVTAENRMAFIHHLQTPGGFVDERNKDIAIVKLGVQYEYGRQENEYSQWEKQERDWLAEMELPPFASLSNSTPQVNDRVYSIHYGGGRPPIKFSRHTVTSVCETAGGIPIIKFNPTLPRGASGCPILNKENKLGGLFYGGCAHEGSALQWKDGILPFVQKGVEIIAEVGPYMLQQNHTDIPPELVAMANENSLTIYLANGVVIN